ncbi:MAG: HAMP domain-containing sensor histidine kinase, partial [Bacteroidota bacterium]
ITHELKSPIASIRLVLETLLKRQLRPEQVNKFGQSALKETDRLNTLVNDLLLSAKLENAYQLHLTKVDLVELYSEIVGRTREKYPHARIELYQDDHIPLMEADEPGMTSIAINLVENAVKYSSKPAHIVVKIYCKKESICIEVADHGIGITDKDKKRIFDKFYRVGSEDTRKTKGTGLGLYIVHQLVKTHGGTIVVKDNQPRGTIFKISLPKEGVEGIKEPPKKVLASAKS